MMKKLLITLFIIFCVFLFVYVSLPSPNFPSQLPNSVQSTEPGDVETPLRRAYYTNLNRDEIINYYKKEFNNSQLCCKGFFYTPRLNYPPEEAKTIIRDQTKSTFLEELVHPLRESLFINGFESKKTIYQLVVNGVTWDQKIIIKFVPSNIWIRILITTLTIAGIILLVREYSYVKREN